MIYFLRFVIKVTEEFSSKITTMVINLIAIVGLVIGLAEIQQLDFRDPKRTHITLQVFFQFEYILQNNLQSWGKVRPSRVYHRNFIIAVLSSQLYYRSFITAVKVLI